LISFAESIHDNIDMFRGCCDIIITLICISW